jgi:signal transduction histidine kinase
MIGRLREQERLRQEFIANASHELKTPTMAISSVVEALQAGAAEEPQLRRQFLGSLERLAERQTHLIQDLLDVTRLDALADANWREEVRIEEVIIDAMDEIKPQADKKGIQLNSNLEENGSRSSDGQMIHGNGNQLHRALVNLLTNAVNYTLPEGKVNVQYHVIDSKEVEIQIIDTGAGIDPEDLPRIFDRFYRGDKARTRTGGGGSPAGGTGLGLAITREIIQKHHGIVEVESELGKGSTFTVLLPIE